MVGGSTGTTPTGAALITTRRRTPAPSMACVMAAVAGATIPAWAARLGPTAEITASASRSASARTSLFGLARSCRTTSTCAGSFDGFRTTAVTSVTGSNGLAEDLAADATGGAEQGELHAAIPRNDSAWSAAQVAKSVAGRPRISSIVWVTGAGRSTASACSSRYPVTKPSGKP